MERIRIDKLNVYIDILENIDDEKNLLNTFKIIANSDKGFIPFIDMIYSDRIQMEIPKDFGFITKFDNYAGTMTWTKSHKKLIKILTSPHDKNSLELFKFNLELLDNDECTFIISCVKTKSISPKIEKVWKEYQNENK